MLTQLIPSSLYVQYNDDADLQAFVDAFNALAQEYVTWFATVGLPVYTGLSGSLLDWAVQGIYGLERPIVPTETAQSIGPINSMVIDFLPINGSARILNGAFGLASDDIFKRFVTWQFYKGDGTTLSVEWLKRRIVRFLTGANGVDPGVQETYGVSIQFGGGNQYSIRIYPQFDPYVTTALAYLLNTRLLELPFQFTFDVLI